MHKRMGLNVKKRCSLALPFHKVLLFLLITLAFVYLAWKMVPDSLGIDWYDTFKPAADAFLSGENPYSQVEQFFVAPWTFVFFIPLSILPERLGFAFLLVIGLLAYAFISYRLGAAPIGVALIILSPQVLHNLLNGNIDWLVFLGFILPRPVGLLFLAIKPQIGLALGIYWLVDAIKQKQVVSTFLPVLLITLLSFFIFDLWPFKFSQMQPEYNASAWPISLPFGLMLLWFAIRYNNEKVAQAISPLMSPHVMFHSWASMLLALAPNTVDLAAAVMVSWLFFIWSTIVPFL